LRPLTNTHRGTPGSARERDAHPNLAFCLADTAAVIAELRAEGHQVLVHCVRAQQRTPSVAVAYARHLGVGPDEARRAVATALPRSRRKGRLWDVAAGDGEVPSR